MLILVFFLNNEVMHLIFSWRLTTHFLFPAVIQLPPQLFKCKAYNNHQRKYATTTAILLFESVGQILLFINLLIKLDKIAQNLTYHNVTANGMDIVLYKSTLLTLHQHTHGLRPACITRRWDLGFLV